MTGHTEPAWPEPVPAFEEFLKSAGLTCLRREAGSESDGKLLQYASAIIGVRLVFDGCAWVVEVAGVPSPPGEWYDTPLLWDLLDSGQTANTLPLAEQIAFVRANWRAIVRAFDPIRRADAQMRLAFLRGERAKRRSKPTDGNASTGAETKPRQDENP